ncbi:VOC family protein [uncultured Stenotrophomonas sp.]|uniref:VOC family protein n=1 Tax=uncultured Stenotrophomonas sp. TaxID=165438 RepID=UPI0025E03594|nr:VOC family protein [uncultured Stenotrophomonas sp.]
MAHSDPSSTGSTIIPCLRYRNALTAIDWLQRAFGFHAQAVYAEGETVFHAQLVFGKGMVMLGSASNSGEWSKLAVMPDEVDGRQTQSACVIVPDADTHYARAKAAGARIVIDIADQDYGGRGYACADPEGYLWWFGSYDPWRADHGQ